jgi:hypothetical protein
LYRLVVLALSLTLHILANNLIEVTVPNDRWTLIGVPGGFVEGASSIDFSSDATDGSTDWQQQTASDGNTTAIGIGPNHTDNNNTEYNSSIDTISFKIEDNSTVEDVSLNVNIKGRNYSSTAPTRYMYISADGNSTTNIKIGYQAHYEGETFEFIIKKVDGTTGAYEGTFNSGYSSSDPYGSSTKPLTVKGSSSDKRYLGILTTLDMNLSNNPGKPDQNGSINGYSYTLTSGGGNREELNTTEGDYLRVWRRDSTNNYWESFHSNGSNNDFDTFVPGGAYWVKLHDANRETNSTGFLFGDGEINSTTFTVTTELGSDKNTSLFSGHSLLNSGWNMLSFGDSMIRNSGTGLLVDCNGSASSETFRVADGTGREELTVTLSGGTPVEVAKSINSAVYDNIIEGNVSRSFNLRAFTVGTTDHTCRVALISTKRFRVYDGSGDSFGAVTTLGGDNPYDLTTNSYIAVSDLATTGIRSRFGEYALVVSPNGNGYGDTNDPIDSASVNKGKIEISQNPVIDSTSGTAVSLAVADINSSMSTPISTIEGISYIDKVSLLDVDLNENNDSLLIVSKTGPFYVRDHTFSRAYYVDEGHSTGYSVSVDDGNGTITEEALGTTPITASSIATEINANGTVNSYAKAVSNGSYLYLVTDTADHRRFDLKDSPTRDIFKPVTSSDSRNLGAITSVYSLYNLGTADINSSGEYTSIDKLTSDLTYIPVRTPDFSSSSTSPMALLKSAGYQTIFLLGAVTNSSGSSWHFVDTTKDIDEWFNEIDDYSLFSTDAEKGYWVYLQSDSSSMSMTTPTLSKTFSHHFNNDSDNNDSTQNLSVTNSIYTATITVPDVSQSSEAENLDVVATIDGNSYQLQSGDGNEYKMEFSSYEIPALSESNHTITVRASDDVGNSAENSTLSIDLEKPANPFVRFIDGKHIVVASSSSDVHSFRIYSGRIEDNSTESNLVTTINSGNYKDFSGLSVNINYSTNVEVNSTNISRKTPYVTFPSNTNATSILGKSGTPVTQDSYYYYTYNICKDISSIETLNSGWRMIAIDGDGDLNNSLSSDISMFHDDNNESGFFYNFYKDSSILFSKGDNSVIDSSPRLYDSNCEYSEDKNSSENNGVILVSTNSSDTNISVAYKSAYGNIDTSNIPTGTTLYFNGSAVAKIQFDKGAYVSSENGGTTYSLFVDINNSGIYRTTFDDLNQTDNNGSTYLELNTTKVNILGQTIDKTLL